MLHVFANDARSGTMSIQLKGRPEIFKDGQRMGLEPGLKAKFNDGYFRVDDEKDKDGAEILELMLAHPNFECRRKSRRFLELSQAEIDALDGVITSKEQVRSTGPKADHAGQIASLENQVKELTELVRTSMARNTQPPSEATKAAKAIADAAEMPVTESDEVEEIEEDVEEPVAPPAVPEAPPVAPPADPEPAPPVEDKKPEKPKVDYTSWNKKKLEGTCKARKLDQTGNRDDLISRLVVSDNAA